MIDGTPLPELNLRSWRHMIGYVPQDTILLHDSIFINVTLGEPSLTLRGCGICPQSRWSMGLCQ